MGSNEQTQADTPVERAHDPIVLWDNEQYRMQMAEICTAALGCWKEGDSIHPYYDTTALREVAKLYAKYDVLFKRVHGGPVYRLKCFWERMQGPAESKK